MKIPRRLEAVASLIEQYGHHQTLADIGSDHAYLPCFLVQHHVIQKGYACEVAVGPFHKSQETIMLYGLTNEVEALLGDGLTPILNKPVEDVSICGMGGYLIVDILDRHINDLKLRPTLFLQANTGCDYLRRYLYEHQWSLIDEMIVEDSHHLYEIMVARYQDVPLTYKEEDFIFGPILRKRKDVLFLKKWQRELTIKKQILTSLHSNHEKYDAVKRDILRIEAILNEG